MGIIEGKLLGHVVTKQGIKIDLEIVKAIKEISLPKNLKALRYFFGKINFIHRFIPNFIEITKPLNKLLKKDVDFRWTEEAKKAFEYVKEAITRASVLISPVYSNPFQFFSFPSTDIIARVLLQKNDKNEEKPIAFMSKALSKTELNYHSMESKHMNW